MSENVNKKIEIVKENKVYENRYGRLYDDRVHFTSSDTFGTYVRWVWNTPYSVAVLPILPNGDIIMIESFRHAARKSSVEVPKGFGKIGVAPSEVAKVELLEEAGLICSSLDYVGETITDPAFVYNPMHLFIARNCEITESQHESSEVITGLKRIPLNKRQCLPFEITTDAVSILLLFLAQKS